MSILKTLIGAITPITKLIDELHTSIEERDKIRLAIVELQAKLTAQIVEYEQRMIEQQAQIITAEAKGHSWLQRNWRPITMLIFLGLVVLDMLGLLQYRLPDPAWTLLQIGLGGYVIGRTGEKISGDVIKLIDKKGTAQ